MNDLYVFISYSHHDALECAKTLKAILKEMNIDCFLDVSGLKPTNKIRAKILGALKKATHLLMILSDRSANSEWSGFERGYAHARKLVMVPFSADGTARRVPYVANMTCILDHNAFREYFEEQKENWWPRGIQNPKKPVTKDQLAWNDLPQGIQILVDHTIKFSPDMIFGICRGGGIVGNLIAKRLNLKAIHKIWVPEGTGPTIICRDFVAPENPRILLLDDAIHFGKHMRKACRYLRRTFPNCTLSTAVLLKNEFQFSSHESSSRRSFDVDCFAYFANRNKVVKLPWDNTEKTGSSPSTDNRSRAKGGHS